jgi:hypothetical protein
VREAPVDVFERERDPFAVVVRVQQRRRARRRGSAAAIVPSRRIITGESGSGPATPP